MYFGPPKVFDPVRGAPPEVAARSRLGRGSPRVRAAAADSTSGFSPDTSLPTSFGRAMPDCCFFLCFFLRPIRHDSPYARRPASSRKHACFKKT